MWKKMIRNKFITVRVQQMFLYVMGMSNWIILDINIRYKKEK
jgi:hypothetical protein